MNTLKIDTALLETTEALSDAEIGRLYRGMLKYAFSGEDVQLSGNERFFWAGVKADIDKQLKAYSARSENMRKARENNPNNNSDLLNNRINLLNNNGQEREEEKREEKGEEKSSPSHSPVKENPLKEESKEEENINNNNKRPRKAFVPPTLEEVRAYCQLRKNSVDPVKFYEYFTEGGWKDSEGKPVLSWKQKILTWEKYNPPVKQKPNQITGSAVVKHSDDTIKNFMAWAKEKGYGSGGKK